MLKSVALDASLTKCLQSALGSIARKQVPLWHHHHFHVFSYKIFENRDTNYYFLRVHTIQSTGFTERIGAVR
jgi:hypothetical protein